MSGFTEPKYNTVFDKDIGTLYSFDPYEIQVIQFGGRYPIASRKSEDEPYWTNFIPEDRFPFLFTVPVINEKNKKAEENKYLKKYLKLNDELVRYLGAERVALVKKFRWREWFMLCLLMNGGKHAESFVQLNPALSFLLSAHAMFHPLKSKKYWRSVRSLILKPRKDILAYFGFPRREAVVTLFEKLDPKFYTPALFFWLRKELFKRPELIRQLSFFPSINAGVLSLILSDYSKHMKFELLEDISTCEEEFESPLSYFKLRDIFRMQDALKQYSVDEKVPMLRRRTQIEAYHDMLVEKLNDIEDQVMLEYPKSLLENVYSDKIIIEKIEDSHELKAEGQFMNHCIFSYQQDLLKGYDFVARVIEPQRLTVHYREFMNNYRLMQVRGKHNSDARDEVVEMIKDWLNGKIDFDEELEERRRLADEKYQMKLFEEVPMGVHGNA